LSLSIVVYALLRYLQRAGVEYVTVTQIIVYPIKSCGAVHLTAGEVGPRGFLYDRQWLIVKMSSDSEKRAYMVTQRQNPHLATIAPSLPRGDNDSVLLTGSLPNAPHPVEVPAIEEGREIEVRIWSDEVVGIDQGDAAAEWLCEYLDTPRLRLIRMANDYVRGIDKDYGGTLSYNPNAYHRSNPPQNPDVSISFADGFPFLITNEASLADLNARLGRPAKLDAKDEPTSVGVPFDLPTRTQDGFVRIIVPKKCALPAESSVLAAMSKLGSVRSVQLNPNHSDGFEVVFASYEVAMDALAKRIVEIEGVPCSVQVCYKHKYCASEPIPDHSHLSVFDAQPKCQPFYRRVAGIDMRRFRPNIVVSGAEAWDEDSWAQVITPCRDFVLDVMKPCSRCTVPSVNQVNGTRPVPEEPRKTLQSFRSGKHLGYKKKWHKEVYFGQNLLHREQGAVISVGDVLEVRKRMPWHRLPRVWTEGDKK